MSSTYRILCMSHDPALFVHEIQLRDIEATTICFEEHPNCDLIAARVSGAPVEFGCLGSLVSSQNTDICQSHRSVEWADVDWLLLLAYVRDDQSEVLQSLRRRPTLKCWAPERLIRLRFELEG